MEVRSEELDSKKMMISQSKIYKNLLRIVGGDGGHSKTMWTIFDPLTPLWFMNDLIANKYFCSNTLIPEIYICGFLTIGTLPYFFS